jgi:hypothetical protein
MDVIIPSRENQGHPLLQKTIDKGANHTYSVTTNFYFLFLHK